MKRRKFCTLAGTGAKLPRYQKGMLIKMKWLISKRDPALFPKTAIGKQKCGIIFWQKTGLLRHCNCLGFNAIVSLVNKKFSPSSVQKQGDTTYFLTFNNDNDKVIYLNLKREENSKHRYIYGESHTVYAGKEFHLFALSVVEYIAKEIGSKFYVDDATGYAEHHSEDRLQKYISDYMDRFHRQHSEREWKLQTIGSDGNIELFGVNIFDYHWVKCGMKAHIDGLPYEPDIFYIVIDGQKNFFSAHERSNCVWEIFLYESKNQ